MSLTPLQLNKLEDSAAGRAIEAFKKFAGELPLFVDFTQDLLRGTFETIVGSSMEQLEAYAELVSKVAGGLAAYEQRVLGADPAPKVREYINQVILPNFAQSPTSIDASTAPTTSVVYKPDRLSDLKGTFEGVTATFGSTEKVFTEVLNETGANSPSTTFGELKAFSEAKLRREVRGSFDRLETILRLGLQRTVVTAGAIETAVTFHVDSQERDAISSSTRDSSSDTSASSFGLSYSSSGSGGLALGIFNASFSSAFASSYSSSRVSSRYRVNVVNETKSAVTNLGIDLTGRVKIEFRSDFFPLFDPSKVPTPADSGTQGTTRAALPRESGGNELEAPEAEEPAPARRRS
ncbi:MAG TPA: hypothetical protein PK413_14815 [Thermoanaerobaculia bacterium]|nr:hypothetical protein [Thermoanaerobaculia bacterium]